MHSTLVQFPPHRFSAEPPGLIARFQNGSGRIVGHLEVILGPDLSGESFGSHLLLPSQGSSFFCRYIFCEVRSLARTVP
jgi:hypothetical protein